MPQLNKQAVSVTALSGQSITAFEDWFVKKEQQRIDTGKTIILLFFYALTETMRNSEIIEWFDSIEFYINIEVIKDKELGYVRGFDADVTFHLHGDLMTVNADCLKEDIYNTRDEAVLKAIQKASEVYNTKYIDNTEAEH
jgi:hypothetical protein